MTILLRLLNQRLEYVTVGHGSKVHARWVPDLSPRKTECSRPVSSHSEPLPEREIDTERLCQTCCSSLHTTSQVELVSEEVEA